MPSIAKILYGSFPAGRLRVVGQFSYFRAPATIDKDADWMISPRSAGVEMSTVQRFHKPYVVETFTLQDMKK